jgi:DNA-binding FadR family transcriptional regulator
MLIYIDRLDCLAPLSNNFAYVRAVEKLLGIENKIPKRIENPQIVLDYLSKGLELDSINKLYSNPREITNFDWNMHRILCKHSNNIIFLFLLNSFKEIYFYFGVKYFSLEEAREHSIKFYNNFYKYILKNQKEKAIQEMKNVTKDSIEILKKALTKNKEKL